MTEPDVKKRPLAKDLLSHKAFFEILLTDKIIFNGRFKILKSMGQFFEVEDLSDKNKK